MLLSWLSDTSASCNNIAPYAWGSLEKNTTMPALDLFHGHLLLVLEMA
jgi:hypothetical protein